MKVIPNLSSATGHIGFTIYAETDAEKILLYKFIEEVNQQDRKFHIHSYGGEVSMANKGHDSFRFGSIGDVKPLNQMEKT